MTGRANLFDYCRARIQKVLSEGVQRNLITFFLVDEEIKVPP